METSDGTMFYLKLLQQKPQLLFYSNNHEYISRGHKCYMNPDKSMRIAEISLQFFSLQ